VERGYATVVRHRKDDEDRSSSYDTLLELEQTYPPTSPSLLKLVPKPKRKDFIPVKIPNTQVKGLLMLPKI
jgi:staphylococcal nuclease domain-containing protein 1